MGHGVDGSNGMMCRHLSNPFEALFLPPQSVPFNHFPAHLDVPTLRTYLSSLKPVKDSTNAPL
jgi:hypothetical protein